MEHYVSVLMPFVLFVLALIVSLQIWLVKRSFAQENSFNLLKQAVTFYIDSAGKGAAILLNTPNPAPTHIRPLLEKFSRGKLDKLEERQMLMDWAKTVAIDPNCPNDERGIAYQLAGAIGALKRIPDVTRQ